MIFHLKFIVQDFLLCFMSFLFLNSIFFPLKVEKRVHFDYFTLIFNWAWDETKNY